MPRSRSAKSISSPKVDDAVDRGDPFVRAVVDGFLKIGTVAATRAAAEDAYFIAKKGSFSSHNFEKTLEKMGEQMAYWGAVGAVYAGVECEVSRIRGTRDWKTAMIGGALTGLTVSAANNNNRDRVALDAITGGAIAAAAEFLNNLT